MDLGISGKRALVTGGTKGLGRAICDELAAAGCRVIVASRTQAAVDQTVKELCARFGDDAATGLTIDLLNKVSIEEAFRSMRTAATTPEILIYNNTGPSSLTFETATDEDFEHAYRSSIMGLVWCVRAIAEEMKKAEWGRIVSIGSMCVRQPHRDPALILHNVARAAEAGLHKTLAADLAPYGINLNSVAPGSMDTDLFRDTYTKIAAETGTTLNAIITKKSAAIPSRRLGRPDEVAAVCAFLCSDRAGYVVGQTILVDGGRVEALF